jgi:glycosyltransferase involved in cell wall biosynthesis
MAHYLPRDEFTVNVLTTCAEDLRTWRNVFPKGRSVIEGVPVYRFPIDQGLRDEKRYWELMIKFTNRWPTTVDEEYEWIAQNAHSPTLYDFIDRNARAYDYLIFVPYLFGITFYGAALHPERSILWPCLHDEPFAYFLETQLMMSACRGLMFNCEPEKHLALNRIGVKNPGACIVGAGMQGTQGDPDRFRRKYDVHDPFMVYSGRLASMKNLLQLFDFFVRYKEEYPGPLKLVLLGKGDLQVPRHPDILPLGFFRGQDKWDAYAAASVLCQPSLLESFSIVIMESWLSGVPVLVHGDCDVTRYHVLKSNGGLYFSTYNEFSGALGWMMNHTQKRKEMGVLGREYVRRQYNWGAVLKRFREALSVWETL